MMNSINAIDHLYAYEDGDTITPAMGVSWVKGETGLGLQQYWNPSTKTVIATDFKVHPALLFPKPYSSRLGNFIVPEANGQQWYYGNITDEGGILENGKVKSKWASLFEVTTIEYNGMTLPALKIKDNLATEADHTDKYIYYKSSYEGKEFVCQQLIPIQESVGETYKVLVSCTGKDGSGDNVLSNENDEITFAASLQRSGLDVSGASYQWYRNVGGEWKAMSTVKDMYEVNGSTLVLHNAGVEGTENYRCKVTYQGKVYYGTAEATDIRDPFYIMLNRSIPSQFVNSDQTVTYAPKVYDRASGEISTGWSFTFSFTNGNGEDVNGIDKKNPSIKYSVIKENDSIAVSCEANR